MDNLQSGQLEDGTAIGTAIATAASRLKDSKAKSRVIILLTDGANNMGELSPVNAAQPMPSGISAALRRSSIPRKATGIW